MVTTKAKRSIFANLFFDYQISDGRIALESEPNKFIVSELKVYFC